MFNAPVSLEPLYRPLFEVSEAPLDGEESIYAPEPPPEPEQLVRRGIWMDPDQSLNWSQAERFLKQAPNTSRIGFEIIGNSQSIDIQLLCRKEDSPSISVAFQGEYPNCHLSEQSGSPLETLPVDSTENILLYDCCPEPLYSDLFTVSSEMHDTPFKSLFAAFNVIPPPALGVYQVLFQAVPASHDWSDSIRKLIDLEYLTKLVSGVGNQQRIQQQSPSGDLRGMAHSVGSKSHNDKPIFTAAARIALLAAEMDSGPQLIRGIAAFMQLYQHGGRPLGHLTEQDYQRILPRADVFRMLRLGLTYRAGFILNSEELASFVHLPCLKKDAPAKPPLKTIDKRSQPPDEESRDGLLLGVCCVGDREYPLHLSSSEQNCALHVIGIPRRGKSVLLENMCLDDIEKGHGIALIDPHGDLARKVASLIPDSRLSDAIFFDPADKDWAPLWNPFLLLPGQDFSQTVDCLLKTIKNLAFGWGDKLEHILRYTLAALLHLKEPTLAMAQQLLSCARNKRDAIRQRILDSVHDPDIQAFWRDEFSSYRADDLAPAKHKISKIIDFGSLSAIFRHPANRLNFLEIMDSRRIFIADLSSLGTETRNAIGGLLLSLFQITALLRSKTAVEARNFFRIYLDEAGRFVSGAIGGLITETQKYGVSLVLSHQYLSQFDDPRTVDALGTAGATAAFTLLENDAEQMRKTFLGQVSVDDFLSLPPWHAFVRTGGKVSLMKTLPPREITNAATFRKVLDHSHACYCRPLKPFPSVIPAWNPEKPDARNASEDDAYEYRGFR